MKFSWSHSMRWSVMIASVTFLLACTFSITSTIVLKGVVWGIGMIIVLLLILTGVVFDMLGIASAAAKETPFLAMSAEKVKGARHALAIVRNADRFSNFCSDVIGDICGVISGSATAFVVIKLLTSLRHEDENSTMYTVVGVIFAGIVSALTVGGKALGKSFSIHQAESIVLWIGKFFYMLEHRLGIVVFNTRRAKTHGKRGNKRAARTNQETR